jgi:hypothetical protein
LQLAQAEDTGSIEKGDRAADAYLQPQSFTHRGFDPPGDFCCGKLGWKIYQYIFIFQSTKIPRISKRFSKKDCQYLLHPKKQAIASN